MTSPMAVRPATVFDALGWYHTCAYPASGILGRRALQLQLEEITRIRRRGDRYSVDFVRDGLCQQILLRSLPAEISGMPVIPVSWFDLWKERAPLIRWSASVSYLGGIVLGYALLRHFYPLLRHAPLHLFLLAPAGFLIGVPYVAAALHAGISWARSRDFLVHRMVRNELFFFTLSTLILVGLFSRFYIQEREAHERRKAFTPVAPPQASTLPPSR